MPTPSFISALKSDRCVHYLNNSLINRAQSIDLNANVPTSVIDELGNESHAGIVTDPAEVSFSVSVLDTGLDLTRCLTQKDSGASFQLNDFVGAKVDYMGVVRDNLGNFFRSVYVRGANINSINYSFDAAGNANEAYGFVADNLTVFDGYVLTKTYTVQASDASAGYFTLPLQGDEAPVQTQANTYFNGAYFLRVSKTADGVITDLVEGNDYSYVPASKRINASGLTAGDKWTLVFYSTAASIAPIFDTTAPPAVKGRFTPISIGIVDKTVIPRLQSARISVSVRRDRITQLGLPQVLYAPAGVPDVSGNLSVLMNDLSLRKLLTYGAGTAEETQFGIEQLAQFGTVNNLGLEVTIKSPVDNSVLKKITVADIVTTSGGMPAAVNGTLTENFNWKGKSGSLTITNS